MKKILVVLMILLSLSSCQLIYNDTVIVTVTGKERVQSGDTSKYLIFTEGETFENTDFLFGGKFNSSDIYGKIEIGSKYRISVGGKRIPILSMYRNIHSIRELK